MLNKSSASFTEFGLGCWYALLVTCLLTGSVHVNAAFNLSSGQAGISYSYPVPDSSTVNDGPRAPEKLASFDDKAPITISVSDVVVNEDAGFAEFDINLSRAPGADSVEFDYQTLDQSATNGLDYIHTSDVITLKGAFTSTRVSVGIVDDLDEEGSETFSLEILNVIGAVIARSTGLATITDNDQQVQANNILSVSDLQVREDESEAVVKFSLSQPPGQIKVEFNYTTVGYTAAEGEDFIAQSGLMQFTGSETGKFVKIPILNDSEVEQTETFVVQISNLYGANIVNSAAEISINDDDTPTTNTLFWENVSVDESAGVAVIKISLSIPPGDKTVEFNFSTHNGTAVDGIDFSGESGFTTITGNVTEKMISIPIFDDDESEGLETFDVEISNLVGAEIDTPIVTATIIDNDQISNTLSIDSVTVNEDAGAVVFKFSLAQAPGTDAVEFKFTTADGTAIDGQDYSGITGYRTMQGPTREMYLSIPILDDNQIEPSETFKLLISNVSGAQFDGASPTATILDDESPF